MGAKRVDNGFRWLTVSPQGQPDFEIALMPIAPGQTMDQESGCFCVPW
ncbi:MAG: hypothetical protein ACLP59_12045 [Bryobacteraceae bacterium]